MHPEEPGAVRRHRTLPGELGVLAQRRGDYDTARKLYEQSLHIKEELGDWAGMANTYHNLGILAQDQR